MYNRHCSVCRDEEPNPSNESHGIVEQKEKFHKASKEEKHGYVKQHRNGLHGVPHAEIFNPCEKVRARSCGIS